ncbi:TIM44-like domain-containing protein [Roseomonas sp. JC162]|uniref:TIM44-like domain-containing protein n=1 Tax=Neoroseomonas marina TaxID=1232220 RepID=A0A848EA51_9PROT|nr:TIM44-like domain-containing protein [Neoroseomonas marina]NMJ41351.1 TIM44-like domain-containing protein [Neoroseomonas marina]
MRRTGRFLTALAALALVLVPVLAEARPGGGSSSGSRGSRTYSAPPSTQTAPSGAQRFDRTATQPSSPATARPGMAPGAQPSRGFFGSFGGALLAGGLIGALLGYGLFGGGAGFGAVLGMLLQVALIGLLVMLVVRFFRRRQAPAVASGPQGYAFQPQPEPKAFGGTGGMKAAAPVDAPLAIGPSDYQAFEQTLKDINAAWSRRDLQGLRAVATPEMVSYFAQDLRDLEARNWRNETRDVRLEQGDLAEAWSEEGEDYATVAMRFSMLDATFDNATNKVVEGSTTQRTEATELWTFVRKGPGGKWMLSGIQQTQPA